MDEEARRTWNEELLRVSTKPQELPITGEPYDPAWGTIIQKSPPVIEDLILAIGRLILNLARRLVAFMNREDDDLDSIRYGHVPLVLSGELGTELIASPLLTAGKVTMIEAINNMRAMYGYEPLPEDKPEYEDMIVPYPQIDI